MTVKFRYAIDSSSLSECTPIVCWKPQGGVIAVTSPHVNSVGILDASGDTVSSLGMDNCISNICWESEGDVLAISQANSTVVTLWNHVSGHKKDIKCENLQITWIQWSKTTPMLAIGTESGAVFIYDNHSHLLTQLEKKATSNISHGSWDLSGTSLCVASDSSELVQYSMSSSNGSRSAWVVSNSHTLSGRISQILYSKPHDSYSVISAIISDASGERLLLIPPSNTQTSSRIQMPLEISLESKFGHAIGHVWLHAQIVVVGFSSGFILGLDAKSLFKPFPISDSNNNIDGQVQLPHNFYEVSELHKIQVCSKGMSMIQVYPPGLFGIPEVLLVGEAGAIKFISPSSFREVDKTNRISFSSVPLIDSSAFNAPIASVSICPINSSIIAIQSKIGHMIVLNVSGGQLFDKSNSRIVSLKGAGQPGVELRDFSTGFDSPIVMHLAQNITEVTAVAVSKQNVLVASAKDVSIFKAVTENGSSTPVSLLRSFKIPTIAEHAYLSDRFALLSAGGKLFLYDLKSSNFGQPMDGLDESIIEAKIIGQDLLVAVYPRGHVVLMSIADDLTLVAEFHHPREKAIRNFYTNGSGCTRPRIVLVDITGDAFIWTPAHDCFVLIEFPATSTHTSSNADVVVKVNPGSVRVVSAVFDSVHEDIFTLFCTTQGEHSSDKLLAWTYIALSTGNHHCYPTKCPAVGAITLAFKTLSGQFHSSSDATSIAASNAILQPSTVIIQNTPIASFVAFAEIPVAIIDGWLIALTSDSNKSNVFTRLPCFSTLPSTYSNTATMKSLPLLSSDAQVNPTLASHVRLFEAIFFQSCALRIFDVALHALLLVILHTTPGAIALPDLSSSDFGKKNKVKPLDPPKSNSSSSAVTNSSSKLHAVRIIQLVALARISASSLQLQVATDSLRVCGAGGMVQWLEELLRTEDRESVAAGIAIFEGDYDNALSFMIRHTPKRAVDLLCDLGRFDEAATICETAPALICSLVRVSVLIDAARENESGRQDSQVALKLYEQALDVLMKLNNKNSQSPSRSSPAGFDRGAVLSSKAALAIRGENQNSSVDKTEQLGLISANELANLKLLRADSANPLRGASLFNLAKGGVARCSVRLGDIGKGLEIARDLNDVQVCKQCAQVLEDLMQFADAAEMYLQAGVLERAATLFLRERQFERAVPLLNSIENPKLHLLHAKQRVETGNYSEAVIAFQRAGAYDEAAILYLGKLNDPQGAFKLVKSHPPGQIANAALSVAEFCQRRGDIASAIEFLILGGKITDACDLAEKEDALPELAVCLQGNMVNTSDLEVPKKVHDALAAYFEKSGRLRDAGRHIELGGDYERALKMYLNAARQNMMRSQGTISGGGDGGALKGNVAAEAEAAVEDAIRLVGIVKNKNLTELMEKFLLGDDDMQSVACDPRMVYKLQIALEKLYEASVTAAVIAQQDQREGSYKEAHSLLVKTARDLRCLGHPVSADIMQQLTVLHSYVLVRPTAAKGDHMRAAKLLLRVADKIDLFPSHTVPLLTSAVIECHRAKLGRSAVRLAAVLMRPEYRASVGDTYRKKVESIVRRPSAEEATETSSPCPSCFSPLEDSRLECPKCLTLSPACIASGMHLLPDDSTFCPVCEFPARYHDLIETLKTNNGVCPMCDEAVRPSELVKVPAKSLLSFYLKKAGALTSATYNTTTEKKGKSKQIIDPDELMA